MAAGALDRRVQFLRKSGGASGFTSAIEWSADPVDDFFGDPVWASKVDVSDAERWRASEVAATITTRFKVRWSPFARSITPDDRLECEGLLYEITGIKEGKGRHRWIELTCAARSDQ